LNGGRGIFGGGINVATGDARRDKSIRLEPSTGTVCGETENDVVNELGYLIDFFG